MDHYYESQVGMGDYNHIYIYIWLPGAQFFPLMHRKANVDSCEDLVPHLLRAILPSKEKEGQCQAGREEKRLEECWRNPLELKICRLIP